MWLPTKPRPVLASFVAGGVFLLPVLIMAAVEIFGTPGGVVSADSGDDAALQGAGLAFAAAPFLYIFAVPASFLIGRALHMRGFLRLWQFLLGAISVAFLISIAGAAYMSYQRPFGLYDALISLFVVAVLMCVCTLPAAVSWWLLAVQPHNRLLQPTGQHRPMVE